VAAESTRRARPGTGASGGAATAAVHSAQPVDLLDAMRLRPLRRGPRPVVRRLPLSHVEAKDLA